jgi:hypothetical protein
LANTKQLGLAWLMYADDSKDEVPPNRAGSNPSMPGWALGVEDWGLSMLNFYINRAGSNLSEKQKSVLVRAKGELRTAFHRE